MLGASVRFLSLGRRTNIKWSRNNNSSVKSPGQPASPPDAYSAPFCVLDVQRAPLEAIELQRGAGSEELRPHGRTGERSESWVGKTM